MFSSVHLMAMGGVAAIRGTFDPTIDDGFTVERRR
jgi:hypothetical protein